jgi:hypothetical protein
MINEQFIAICLEDFDPEKRKGPSYVQVTRKRFESAYDVCQYLKGIASSRLPTYAIVPAVEVDGEGYPVVHEDEYGMSHFKLKE